MEKFDTENFDNNERTGMSESGLKRAFSDNLLYAQGKHPQRATPNDFFMALAYSVRDRLLHRSLSTMDTLIHMDYKLVCYFSAEYLLGPLLERNLINLEIREVAAKAINSFGLKFEDIINQEKEPGLGNGGLGRLAACYMDSLATLEVPAIGYGIRYEFGMFEQEIRNGWQVERTDKWLALGNPWEIPRPEGFVEVKLGGHTKSYQDDKGNYRVRWVPARVVKGVPYDTPIVGYGVNNCNFLRLWRAEAADSFDFEAFNQGDYYKAVEEKIFSENISKVLYPNDEPMQGKQLRLEQQYFFVSCSLYDMIRIHHYKKIGLEKFSETFCAQLNDTHPTLAIPELMRIFVDEYEMTWEKAWEITTKTFSYTNHTLLPEALEKWPVRLLALILPRHLEIIYEINRRHLDEIRIKYPDDEGKLARMSIIDETGERYVRMAHLACVGSHAINGVAELHTQLLKKDQFPDFTEMWPKKFYNITNGVTPRRFLMVINPKLTQLITDKIGCHWITHLDDLKKLEPYASDIDFQQSWRQIKLENKRKLAEIIHERMGVIVNPESLFDVQVKRLHEYKRQHLNVLYIITLYNRLKRNPKLKIPPRTFIFGGKAAPGYYMAKLIIKLINSVANVINADDEINDRLKVVFIPNYNLKNAGCIYPAADLSEQISTAGKEASGTGNMKLALNGALTIGTFDGANIEIREAVGAENFFLFGLTAPQIKKVRAKGYSPMEFYDADPHLREAVDLINSGFFSKGDRYLFKPLMDSLTYQDPYMLFADYAPYVDCQDKVSEAYQDQKRWTKMTILNVARMGKFSSDRAIREYCEKIWNTAPVSVKDRELLLKR